MKILTSWLRSYLPALDVDDAQLAEDLTLRGIAVEGVFALSEAAGESAGSLFDMDITTNRVDAMNHYGIAREAAAIYDVPLTPLDTTLPPATPAAAFPVKIEAEDLCGRFTVRVIRGVTVSPSGGLISHYFTELGQKQISNAVDASNFVLLGMGHPTHAFDLDKIIGGITVRRAHAGEQIKLLDGSTRTLVVDDLVVADDVKALGLAGVMGGWDSMITAETSNVLVEAAWFDPATVRASSRRHLIHTDASHRYERGADFAAAPIANALATKAILAACGGTIEGELVDIIVPAFEAATAARPAIRLSIQQVQRHLGTTLAPEGITGTLVLRYLSALGCSLTPADEDRVTAADTREQPSSADRSVSASDGHMPATDDLYDVKLPSWRLDLTREIDLIEEIARVYGYNGFANTLPTPAEVIPHPTARALEKLRARLFELGFSEALSSTFASPADSGFFAPATSAIVLENPLSEEAADLRPSLLSGMVTMLAHNLNRDVPSARLFEMGAIFTGSTDSVQEALSLSVGITGEAAWAPPYALEAPVFFELKGALESVLDLFETGPITTSTDDVAAAFEPGRAASLIAGKQRIASFGLLGSAESAKRKLRQAIYLGELNLEALLKLPLRHSMASELSRFQAVERDFSFTFPDAVLWASIESAIRALGIAELRTVNVIEVWRDRVKFPGVYSMLIHTVFQSNDRTLTDTELTEWHSRIITTLQGLGGVLRG